MKTFGLYAALNLVALGCIGTILAQQPAAAPLPGITSAEQQPSRAEVVRMMDAMRIRSQLESMTKTMNLQMKQQIHETLRSQPNMTPEQISKFENTYATGAGVYPISEMMDDMIPVYQRHMNKADIDAIIAFYASPAGQHLLTEGPGIMKDSMGVLMPKVQARMQTYVEKMKKDIGSDTPKATPTPAAKP